MKICHWLKLQRRYFSAGNRRGDVCSWQEVTVFYRLKNELLWWSFPNCPRWLWGLAFPRVQFIGLLNCSLPYVFFFYEGNGFLWFPVSKQERIYEADFHFRLEVSWLHIFLTNWLCSVLMYRWFISLLDLWMFVWFMYLVSYHVHNVLRGAGAAAPGITEVFCLIPLNGASEPFAAGCRGC